jgi:hypothetical protein
MESTKATVNILKAHSIEVNVAGDRILAHDFWTTPTCTLCDTWLDVTDWTRGELYDWLGY